MSASRSILARTAVIAAVALIVAVIVGPMLTGWRAMGQVVAALTAGDTAGSVKGITVVGTGKVTLKPDLATIVVGVQAQATTAAKAQSQASAATAKIIAAVKGQGVADADITSQWISLQPQYDYSANGAAPPRVTGYQANQSLAVKVRQIDKAGPVIDAAVGAGANQVGGISFSVADPTGATAQARRPRWPTRNNVLSRLPKGRVSRWAPSSPSAKSPRPRRRPSRMPLPFRPLGISIRHRSRSAPPRSRSTSR